MPLRVGKAQDYVIFNAVNGTSAGDFDHALRERLHSREVTTLDQHFVFWDMPAHAGTTLTLAFPAPKTVLRCSKLLEMDDHGLDLDDLEDAIDDVAAYHAWYIERTITPDLWAKAYNGARYMCDTDARNGVVDCMVRLIRNATRLDKFDDPLREHCMALWGSVLYDFDANRRCLPFVALVEPDDSQLIPYCAQETTTPVPSIANPCVSGPPITSPGIIRNINHLDKLDCLATRARYSDMVLSLTRAQQHLVLQHLYPSQDTCVFHDHDVNGANCNAGPDSPSRLPAALLDGVDNEVVRSGLFHTNELTDTPGQHWSLGPEHDHGNTQDDFISWAQEMNLHSFFWE